MQHHETDPEDDWSPSQRSRSQRLALARAWEGLVPGETFAAMKRGLEDYEKEMQRGWMATVTTGSGHPKIEMARPPIYPDCIDDVLLPLASSVASIADLRSSRALRHTSTAGVALTLIENDDFVDQSFRPTRLWAIVRATKSGVEVRLYRDNASALRAFDDMNATNDRAS